MFLIVYLIMIVFIMSGVAFFTLLERKVLSYMQYRKGPNKIGYMGLLQPFSDAVKLFSKEILKPMKSNLLVFFFMPLFNLMMSLLLWLMIPQFFTYYYLNMTMLFFFCLSSLGIYSIILGSWSSNSNYSMLGSMRSIAQMISYEISFAMIILSLVIFLNSMNFYDFYIYQKKMWYTLLFLPLLLMWMISCLAETNRTPFDFSEGESELVSGFNIEYSSVLFAYIFLSEYCSIMFMSNMTTTLFFGSDIMNIFFYMKSSLLCFFFIWIRGTMPRYRYDLLMYLNWKIFLPITIIMIIYYSSISTFFS
uniref:NADH-ubiquinone oxidoreductase chain 1 n=1 Tax=Elaphrothrips spiniceps TaxID=3003602 RepID=A0AA50QWU3_9NEOP|nr:NADH dehydrogenase subunit 1 [Elaphrothrips spiniceps]